MRSCSPYILNLLGKFPGASGERREASFRDGDRSKLDAVHEVVTREDSDKPGWRMVWHSSRETREMRDLLIELSDLRDDWATEREEWATEREEWKTERARLDRRITELEDTVRRQEHALKYGAGGSA